MQPHSPLSTNGTCIHYCNNRSRMNILLRVEPFPSFARCHEHAPSKALEICITSCHLLAPRPVKQTTYKDY
ncbi:hypothetical protein KC338_g144 [Hortaea werneckii]|nr:hypothetical protein KC338_g144 [Hortaea werneckii]